MTTATTAPAAPTAPTSPPTTNRRTLYELTADMQALHDLLVELDGDITNPSVAEAIDGWMNELGNATDKKVDAYCSLIREIESRAAVRKAEMDRLAMRVRADENAVKGLKSRLKLAIELMGKPKIETDRFSVRVQANGGKPPLELPLNVEDLPKKFIKFRPEADQDAIRAAIDAGEEIKGVKLLPRGTHLRIA